MIIFLITSGWKCKSLTCQEQLTQAKRIMLTFTVCKYALGLLSLLNADN